MKVSHLYIDNYNQFKNFELDLTYPAGHPKAGQPLDKVCIIGQSGTGKTSLLNKINWSKSGVYPIFEIINSKTDYIASNGRDYKSFEGKSYIKLQSSTPEKSYKIYDNDSIVYILYKNSQQTNLPYPKRFFIDATTGTKEFNNKNESWVKIVEDIINFQELDNKKKQEIGQVLISSGGDTNRVKLEYEKYEKWVSSILNPIKYLAENFLDKILNKFNLRVKQNFDSLKPEEIAKLKEDIVNLRIETLQGVEVPSGLLSTGTKQVILTTLPLFALKPENDIVLIDEPENSLYPDIQSEIVEFYTSLVKNCQFFFATHSPLIASCFEPWEIVELKFNPDGSVYRELYYDAEKGNHVDNYTIDPRYLRWDSILTRLFDLDKDSNEARTRKLMELATLRSKIQKANGKLSPEERQQLQTQFEKLAELLDWEYDAEN
ncbi:MAG: AAA family ATPase [Spirosomataceae bacterium]